MLMLWDRRGRHLSYQRGKRNTNPGTRYVRCFLEGCVQLFFSLSLSSSTFSGSFKPESPSLDIGGPGTFALGNRRRLLYSLVWLRLSAQHSVFLYPLLCFISQDSRRLLP